MALQKIVVDTTWQSFTVEGDSFLWLPNNANVFFSTGIEDPSEEYDVLSPGINNRICLHDNSTLWLKSNVDTFVFLDDEIIG